MTKAMQAEINETVENAHAVTFSEYMHEHTAWKQLRHCNAQVCETKNFYILKSYNSVVAAINKNANITYDFLRMVYGYTATSAQHISKFRHDYIPYPFDYPVLTWRDI